MARDRAHADGVEAAVRMYYGGGNYKQTAEFNPATDDSDVKQSQEATRRCGVRWAYAILLVVGSTCSGFGSTPLRRVLAECVQVPTANG